MRKGTLFVTVAAGTSPYLGLNGALRSRGGGELQIEKVKGKGFCTSDIGFTFLGDLTTF